MDQNIINLIGGALLAVIGWFARQLWESVQALKNDIKNIEVDLPTHYVRKVDIEARFDKLEIILSKIFDKLDAKADK
jgi:predicted negative regulator of RcsB-dependent stress response